MISKLISYLSNYLCDGKIIWKPSISSMYSLIIIVRSLFHTSLILQNVILSLDNYIPDKIKTFIKYNCCTIKNTVTLYKRNFEHGIYYNDTVDHPEGNLLNYAELN